MQGLLSKGSTTSVWTALVLTLAVFTAPLAGCSSDDKVIPPPVDDTRGGVVAQGQAPQPQVAENTGMSTKKKLVILAGAAALYYLYKKHKSAPTETGVDGQYYLSKNGRVYYRDAEHRAHWVTPPPEGIQVPASEASEYQRLQGYDNQQSGMDLGTFVDQMNLAVQEPTH